MTMITSNQFKTAARKLGLGVLLYKLIYAPRNVLKTWTKWGFINSVLTRIDKTNMEKAVSSLRPLNISKKGNEPSLDIYFMTGRKYWYQTCFCIYSMQVNTDILLRPIIYDDGSLEEPYVEEIIRLFPNTKIVSLEDVEARLDRILPKDKFPMLRERRLKQPLLRKLTDFHAGLSGWKLFLDSDMLFFHEPSFLIDWLKDSKQPCYMVDIKNAYGYPEELMRKLAGAEIPDLVNIGIFGLESEDINWEQLESWLTILLEECGTHYNLTQCLSAMYLADKKCSIVPKEDYVVLPHADDAVNPKATLHHYVAESKPLYFRYGWKHIINR